MLSVKLNAIFKFQEEYFSQRKLWKNKQLWDNNIVDDGHDITTANMGQVWFNNVSLTLMSGKVTVPFEWV
jgi:hypothetical protein